MATLLPNPPPMSGEMIRILCSGRPVTSAYIVRWACGAWLVDQTVSLPLTVSMVGHRAAGLQRRRVHPRVEHVLGHRDSAAAKTRRSAARSPASQSKIRLSAWPAMSSRISGAPGSSARVASTTGGSGSYSRR